MGITDLCTSSKQLFKSTIIDIWFIPMLGRDLRRGSMLTNLIKKTVMADRAYYGIPKINFESLASKYTASSKKIFEWFTTKSKGLSISNIYVFI